MRHGRLSYTYREFEARCRRLARHSQSAASRRGDTVAVMAPNVPGAARGALRRARRSARSSIRSTCGSTPRTIAFCLDARRREGPHHRRGVRAGGQGGARADAEPRRSWSTSTTARARAASALGSVRYEDLLAEGDPAFAWPGPQDEWDSLALLYTSGTTGDPEGRRVPPPRRVSQRARQRARLQARARQRVPVDAADVPLLRLDVHVGGDGGGRHARVPAPRRSGADLRGDPRRARHAPVRRADRAQPARARARRRRRCRSTAWSTSPPAAPRRRRRSSRRWRRWAFA